jgi:hypothetical protein
MKAGLERHSFVGIEFFRVVLPLETEGAQPRDHGSKEGLGKEVELKTTDY